MAPTKPTSSIHCQSAPNMKLSHMISSEILSSAFQDDEEHRELKPLWVRFKLQEDMEDPSDDDEPPAEVPVGHGCLKH